MTKRLILDDLGGSSKEGVSEVVDILKDWGGKEESTVLVFGEKVPCISTTLANALPRATGCHL